MIRGQRIIPTRTHPKEITNSATNKNRDKNYSAATMRVV
ncbi:MAG: hypothetical protein MRERV_22c014 [Mycoplasmataceae bacterium RV_VA103A]|nr:MAG: hypothetical protein MRERV_22c014 [Mycoplasmataceae bacterium RV_VA103A]